MKCTIFAIKVKLSDEISSDYGGQSVDYLAGGGC